ncbi:MAG: hypothetical protein AAGE01_20785 [Pseudomonadota bacterium]
MPLIQLENRAPPPGGLAELRGRMVRRRRRRQGTLLLGVTAALIVLLRPVAVTPPDADVPLARLLAPIDRTVAVEDARVVPVDASVPGVRLVWVVTNPTASPGS